MIRAAATPNSPRTSCIEFADRGHDITEQRLREIVDKLKDEFDLRRGHAMATYTLLKSAKSKGEYVSWCARARKSSDTCRHRAWPPVLGS